MNEHGRLHEGQRPQENHTPIESDAAVVPVVSHLGQFGIRPLAITENLRENPAVQHLMQGEQANHPVEVPEPARSPEAQYAEAVTAIIETHDGFTDKTIVNGRERVTRVVEHDYAAESQPGVTTFFVAHEKTSGELPVIVAQNNYPDNARPIVAGLLADSEAQREATMAHVRLAEHGQPARAYATDFFAASKEGYQDVFALPEGAKTDAATEARLAATELYTAADTLTAWERHHGREGALNEIIDSVLRTDPAATERTAVAYAHCTMHYETTGASADTGDTGHTLVARVRLQERQSIGQHVRLAGSTEERIMDNAQVHTAAPSIEAQLRAEYTLSSDELAAYKVVYADKELAMHVDDKGELVKTVTETYRATGSDIPERIIRRISKTEPADRSDVRRFRNLAANGYATRSRYTTQ